MRIYSVVAFIGIALFSARVFRPPGTRRWLGITLLPLIVLALLLAWHGWHIRVDPPDAIDVAFTILICLLLWLSTRPLILRGSVGMFVAYLRWGRDARFQFDRQVHVALRPLRPLARAVPPQTDDPGWRRAAIKTRQTVLESLLALSAPTADWAELRDHYVAYVRREIETTNPGPTPAETAELRSMRAAISARVVELRTAYGLKTMGKA